MINIPSESLLASIPAAIVWKDEQSCYLAGTQYGARLVGFNGIEQLIGVCDYDLPNELSQYAERFISQDRHVMASNDACDYLELFHYADGPLTVLSKKSPLRTTEQKVIGTCCVHWVIDT